MPHGKPAGQRCVQLDEFERCQLFGDPRRPAGCRSLAPHPDMCGQNRTQALAWLIRLEQQTAPAGNAVKPSPV